LRPENLGELSHRDIKTHCKLYLKVCDILFTYFLSNFAVTFLLYVIKGPFY
jgi:hypothetical protein